MPQQQLLSISIPQQSSVLSPIISPLHLQQLQAQLSQLQVIAIPGKQSVTVDCQTSPTNCATVQTSTTFKFDYATKKQEDIIEEYKKSIYVHKINSSSQTVSQIDVPKKIFENRQTNTDQIVPAPVKATRSQATNVNLYTENKVYSSTQTLIKTYEEKSVQSISEKIPVVIKQKYILYTCKYSYEPFKNSPNDNPEAELPLTAGEYLYVLSEEDEDGFYNGELLNGRRGLVPSNFVERINLDISSLNKYLETLPKSNFKNLVSLF